MDIVWWEDSQMISSVGFTLTLLQPVSLQFIVAEIPSDKVPGVVMPVWSKHFSERYPDYGGDWRYITKITTNIALPSSSR